MRVEVDATASAQFLPAIPKPAAFFHRIWPSAVLILGLIVTIAWSALLGCSVVAFIVHVLDY